MIWIINSDVQIFQIYGHTTRIPDFRVIGPSENRLESDMSDSPDFYISEIRGDRFTDFCVHTPRFLGNRLQKVGLLEKIGQWDHGIKAMPHGSEKLPEKNRKKFVIRCVCHTEGLKSWQIIKKMTHKNLKIVKKTSSCAGYLN